MRLRAGYILLSAIFLLAALPICAVSAADTSPPSDSKAANSAASRYAAQRIIIGLDAKVSVKRGSEGLTSLGVAGIDALNAKFGVERFEEIHPARNARGSASSGAGKLHGNAYLLTYGARIDPLKVAEEYGKLPEVRYAEPDRIRHALRTDPNDTLWATSNSWGQGYRDQWDMEKMACPAAWDVQTGSASVVIAVSDTGIDYTHPDLAANIWVNPGEIAGNGIDDDGNGCVDDIHGFDFAYDDANPMDGDGHGTHVAGTIGAAGNNGIGIAGINWACRLMAVKGLDDEGSGYDSDLAQSIRYAAENGARVINMSWGGEGFSQTVHEAMAYAHDLGVVICVAAGNDSRDITNDHPAMDNLAITVSATDPDDQLCYFSDWGVKIAVAAPGGNGVGDAPCQAVYNCLSTRSQQWTDGSCILTVGGQYARLGGTSMACPHVAGVAGLVLAEHPSWTHEQVRQAIQMRADDILTTGFDRNSGFGRLNAYNAVTCAEPMMALISSPLNGASASGTFEVIGTACGPGMTGWTIDWGLGPEPSAWSTLASGTNPVINDTIASCDSTSLTGGVGTLRLRTFGSEGTQNAEYRIQVTIRTTRGSGHFTEMFEISPFDLDNMSLEFTPDGSPDFYSLCRTPIAQLPTDPAGGAVLYVGDDGFATVSLSGGAQVALYGQMSTTLYVGSNGYVTFGQGDTDFSESLTDHFDTPRISALFDDLDPGSTGTVTWQQLADRAVVTFLNVSEYGAGTTNTFQIEMFYNGRIVVSYLSVAAADGLAGLSAGLGVPANFEPSDLSGYPECIVVGRVLKIVRPNGGEWYEPGAPVQIEWTAVGTDWQPGDTVKLQASADGGTLWSGIPGAGALAYDDGTFNWDTAGAAASSQYKVRVISNSDGAVYDASNANFTIAVDSVAPTITHTPLADTINHIGPYPVVATIADTLGVGAVTLHWSKNGGAFTSIPMAATGTADQFGAEIPGPSATDDVYCYYVEASDLATAPNVAREPSTGSHCFTILPCTAPAPSGPNPADGAVGVPVDVELSWVGAGTFYQEDFNDGLAQDWQPDVAAYWQVLTGEYSASAGTTGMAMQSRYIGDTWADCSVEAAMRLAGDSGVARGIVLRATPDFRWRTDTGSAYLFGLNADGYYYVGKFVSGSWSFLQDWTPSPFLNSGTASNVVKASIEGSTIKVLFNGNLAWSGTDTSIVGPGNVMLMGYSGEWMQAIHYFDDVSIGVPVSSDSVSSAQQWYNAHPIVGGTTYASPAESSVAAASKAPGAGSRAVLDADPGPTTYDVYMGDSCENMILIAANLASAVCVPGPLETNKTYFWKVVAKNQCGETPGPCWSFTTESSAIAKPADGAAVAARSVVVSAVFADAFYVQTEKRGCGIRAEKQDHGLAVGTRVNLSGTMRTNSNGERCIGITAIIPLDTREVRPLQMTNCAVGGGDWMYNAGTKAGQMGIDGASGLNNIGLLVKTSGRVTAHGRDWFYVDDGTCISDGTGTLGIYCKAPVGIEIPEVGAMVSVIGISSCEIYQGRLVNTLLIRGPQEIAGDDDGGEPPPPPMLMQSAQSSVRPRDRK